MVGGDLPRSDPRTVELLTNDAVLAVLKASTDNREVLREGGLVVGTARPTDGAGGRYVAVFNTDDQPLPVRLPLSSAGCAPTERATDLWTAAPVRVVDGCLVDTLAPHSAWLLRVDPGVRRG